MSDRHPYRDKRRTLINAVKGERGCRDCGEKDTVVLDFHHLDPNTKNSSLGRKSGKGFRGMQDLSFDDLVVEMGKCAVLCSNCHRREEYRRRTDT